MVAKMMLPLSRLFWRDMKTATPISSVGHCYQAKERLIKGRFALKSPSFSVTRPNLRCYIFPVTALTPPSMVF